MCERARVSKLCPGEIVGLPALLIPFWRASVGYLLDFLDPYPCAGGADPITPRADFVQTNG